MTEEQIQIIQENKIVVPEIVAHQHLTIGEIETEIATLRAFVNTLKQLPRTQRIPLITLRSNAEGIIAWCDYILEKMQDYPKYLRTISDLGQRFSERTFGNIDSKMDTKARKIALDYAKNFNKARNIEVNGLAFVGNYGIGKTHLAAAISNYLIDNLGVTVCFGTQVELLDKIRGEMSFNRDETKHKMKTLDLLVLDDFGKEKSSEWTDQIMFEVINARYERKLPIIITTNLSAPELVEKYGKAVVSRLVESCQWVMMDGEDRRRR